MSRRGLFASWLALLAGAALIYAPLLRSAFFIVTFDDDAFVVDNPAVHELSMAAVRAWFGHFYHNDYVPVALASFAADYQVWGLWPGGYHMTNVVLHLIATGLVGILVGETLRRADAGFFAAGLFALHPLQLETVSIISQRKTILSAIFALLAMLAYRRYRGGGAARNSAPGARPAMARNRAPYSPPETARNSAPYSPEAESDGPVSTARRSLAYGAALLCFAIGGLAKSSIVPLPALLVLYDWCFERRIRIADKLPFAAIAAVIVWLSVASKAGVGVIKAPHGGSMLATTLLMGRVWAEYLLALAFPTGLSAAYYYRPADVFSPWHFVALAAVVALHGLAWLRRGAWPLAAFALFWFTIAMLPVANIVPIAVVRADRYVYLAMIGPVWWAGSGLAAVAARMRRTGRAWGAVIPYAVLVVAAAVTASSTPVWANDITIWGRAVAVHPWNSRAHYMLGHAFRNAGDLSQADAVLTRAVELDPTFAAPHLLLADLALRRGDVAAARRHLEVRIALAPEDPIPDEMRWVLETPPHG